MVIFFGIPKKKKFTINPVCRQKVSEKTICRWQKLRELPELKVHACLLQLLSLDSTA